MNVFIVFVKFFGWIVVIWVRLIRSIEKKWPKELEGSQLQNEIYNNCKKINNWTRGSGPHLGPSLPVLLLF